MNHPQPSSWGRLLLRYLVLVLCAAFVGILVTLTVSGLQDKASRDRQIAKMREAEAHLEQPPSADNFYPLQVVSRPPLVSGFEIVKAEEAGDGVLPHEMVLAVEIDGAARAYPLNVMTGPDREVFNDTLADTPIAATW